MNEQRFVHSYLPLFYSQTVLIVWLSWIWKKPFCLGRFDCFCETLDSSVFKQLINERLNKELHSREGNDSYWVCWSRSSDSAKVVTLAALSLSVVNRMKQGIPSEDHKSSCWSLEHLAELHFVSVAGMIALSHVVLRPVKESTPQLYQ